MLPLSINHAGGSKTARAGSGLTPLVRHRYERSPILSQFTCCMFSQQLLVSEFEEILASGNCNWMPKFHTMPLLERLRYHERTIVSQRRGAGVVLRTDAVARQVDSIEPPASGHRKSRYPDYSCLISQR
jgi:hypothetical protein